MLSSAEAIIKFDPMRKIFNVNSSEIAAECQKSLESATLPRSWPRVKTDLSRNAC